MCTWVPHWVQYVVLTQFHEDYPHNQINLIISGSFCTPDIACWLTASIFFPIVFIQNTGKMCQDMINYENYSLCQYVNREAESILTQHACISPCMATSWLISVVSTFSYIIYSFLSWNVSHFFLFYVMFFFYSISSLFPIPLSR